MNGEGNGELPKGWVLAKLGDLVNPSSEKVEPTDRPDAPYLSLEHIEPHSGAIIGRGSGSDVNSTKAVFRAGDVLYGKLRPYLNKVTVPDFEGICSTDILVFRQQPWFDSRFLRHFLSTPAVVEFANHNSTGVQLPRIGFDTLGAFEIPLPPLAEQRRIVAAVEAVLAKVNAARDRLNRVPAILKRFRQAVLSAACSGRLTAEWREGSKLSETAAQFVDRIIEARRDRIKSRGQAGTRILSKARNLVRQSVDKGALDELPDGWDWVTWDDLADWITYGFTRPMPHVEQGIPIVSAKNVRDGTLSFDDLEYTTQSAFEELSAKDKPRSGEILITKDGAIRGRAAVVDTDLPFCITQAVAVVRFGGPSADPHYLLRVIQCPFTQRLIDEESSGTAIPHISITDFGRFPVPLPPLTEQQEIVRRIGKLFALADQIEDRLADARQMADRLTQAVLAKAFRGELVPTEAALARRENRPYEPAADLLARIRAERENETPAKKPRAKRTPFRGAST
jgi:type I restriction enzyme, S subunit